jgi:hypothetical protein
MGFLLLGIDSLIACAAVGALVDRRYRIQYAALFGICDIVAFLIGAGLGLTLFSAAASTVLELGTLVVLGVYLLVVAVGTAQITAPRVVWLLPIALVFDNLTYGIANESSGSLAAQAVTQLASSTLMAGIGLALAVWLPRVVPAMRHQAVSKVAGAGLLVAAGALFLVG